MIKFITTLALFGKYWVFGALLFRVVQNIFLNVPVTWLWYVLMVILMISLHKLERTLSNITRESKTSSS